MEWNKLLSGERRRMHTGGGRNGYDNRTEFEKDYHRIIGSASFRRLQDKTQVFPLDKSDFVRTRLTHSLEVSSIAKSLGQTVCARLEKKGKISKEQTGEIQDILLCAGLLHDIGNPPFGHFGENVIRRWFGDNLVRLTYRGQPLDSLLTERMRADLCNFEGNAQSLRVISKLHYLVDANGMNLTKAVMNTIIKYPVPSTGISKQGGITCKKMGYFYADEEVFRSITEATGAGSRRYPLAFLLEAADDIAYSTADIEDGFKKGIIHYHQLMELLQNPFCAARKDEPEFLGCREAAEKLGKLYETARKRGESNPELYAVQNWIVYLQRILITSVTDSFIDNYDAIMEGEYQRELFEGTSCECLEKVLKDIAFKHIFNSKDILKLEIAAASILNFLLDRFVHAAVSYDTDEKSSEKDAKLMELISDNYKRIYRLSSEGKDDIEKLYLRMLLATDYISGMTDHFAKMLYQELNGIY